MRIGRHWPAGRGEGLSGGTDEGFVGTIIKDTWTVMGAGVGWWKQEGGGEGWGLGWRGGKGRELYLNNNRIWEEKKKERKEKEDLKNKDTHFRQNMHRFLCTSLQFYNDHAFSFLQLMYPWKHFTIISCPLGFQLYDLNTIQEKQLFAEYCSLLSSWQLWLSGALTFTENHRHSHSNFLTYRGRNFSQCVPLSGSRNNQSVIDLKLVGFSATICASPLILHMKKQDLEKLVYWLTCPQGAELKVALSNPDCQPRSYLLHATT